MASKTLYIGNIPLSTCEEDLMAHFSIYGCQGARVMRGHGFAYLEVDDERASAAIAGMNGSDYRGRLLNVSVAQPPKASQR